MKETENRRSALRLPLAGLRLQARKRGTESTRYHECHSVDLSNHGLAFTSNSLTLFETEKVDFILTFQKQSIQGSAVVRYVHSHPEYTRYGLMFLKALPEIDTVLAGEGLTTREIRQLSASLAEQVAYAILEKKDKQLRIARQRQRFCDALKAYFERLSEMGIRLPAVHSPIPCWMPARDAIELNESKGFFDFVRYSIERDELIAERIQLKQNAGNETVSYESATGEIFTDLFGVLNFIGDEISLLSKLAHFFPADPHGKGNHSKSNAFDRRDIPD